MNTLPPFSWNVNISLARFVAAFGEERRTQRRALREQPSCRQIVASTNTVYFFRNRRDDLRREIAPKRRTKVGCFHATLTSRGRHIAASAGQKVRTTRGSLSLDRPLHSRAYIASRTSRAIRVGEAGHVKSAILLIRRPRRRRRARRGIADIASHVSKHRHVTTEERIEVTTGASSATPLTECSVSCWI